MKAHEVHFCVGVCFHLSHSFQPLLTGPMEHLSNNHPIKNKLLLIHLSVSLDFCNIHFIQNCVRRMLWMWWYVKILAVELLCPSTPFQYKLAVFQKGRNRMKLLAHVQGTEWGWNHCNALPQDFAVKSVHFKGIDTISQCLRGQCMSEKNVFSSSLLNFDRTECHWWIALCLDSVADSGEDGIVAYLMTSPSTLI